MGMSSGNKGGGINDINITPLVDVVLVLLIIFIVVAPQLQKGVEVQLPAVAKHREKKDDKKKKEEEKNILVSIQQGGGVFIGKDSVGAREDFPKRLRAELQKPENINKPVVIQGDARIPYGEVRRLMKECQELGLGGVALAVKEDQKLGEHERKE
jgi:biopolymer transport protein ExbD/biopolymer transport protein TolR